MDHEYAQKIADEAVKKVFNILGVDVDVPKDVEEFRQDLRFGRSMRRASDRGLVIIIGTLATSTLVALWTGITSKLASFLS